MYIWMLDEVKVLCRIYYERVYLVEEFTELGKVIQSLFTNVASLEEAGIYLTSAIEKNIKEPIEARISEIA